ncbi:MAG: glycosyltransferase family 39 protein [Phascolarctobacterium sp.]|nr:glycosyltransferase family 39 protein [Phascolarctobacterium sp.]
MNQIEKNSLLIIAGVAIVTMFFGLSAVPLSDPDEPAYAETAREMIATGDYVSPRIFGDFWYDKPPVFYCLVALSFKFFGDGEFAARFPAALMAALTAVLLYVSITKIFNERAGFWSALIFGSCGMIFILGKAAVTDTTLMFFTTAALLFFLHRYYWMMYVFMALAVMTKGAIGIMFPMGVICFYILFTGRFSEIRRMHIIRGLILFSALSCIWYYTMYHVHGPDFIRTFLGFHNLMRFLEAEHPGRTSFFYYIPVIIIGLFPWTGLFLQSIMASVNDSRIDEMRKLLLFHVWWLLVLIFFTVCKTKLVSYILPLFPAIAVIIGWYISYMIQKSRARDTFNSWAFGSALMYIFIAAGWMVVARRLPEAEFSGVVLGVLTLLLGFVAALVLVYYKDIVLAAWLHVLTGVVTMCVIFTFVLPTVADRFSVKTISVIYRDNCDLTQDIYVDRFLRPGFMYYAETPGIDLEPKSSDFSNALKHEKGKYFLVRGIEYRRFLKQHTEESPLEELAVIGDIYLLEQK